MKKENITLIGMPGSGKSTIGKLLAKRFDFEFIDGDEYIEKQEKMSLRQIIDTKGDEGFCKIEEKRILELLPLNDCILAPGGSIVYEKKLMNTLKNSSILIFLDLPCQVIEKRVGLKMKRHEQGEIVGLKSKSIKELYEERLPLYKKYQNITINCFRKSDGEIIDEIIKKIN